MVCVHDCLCTVERLTFYLVRTGDFFGVAGCRESRFRIPSVTIRHNNPEVLVVHKTKPGLD